MKKYLSVIFSLLLVLGLFTACTGDKKQDTGLVDEISKEEKKETTEKVESLDRKKVFIKPDWLNSVIEGNQDESKNYLVLEASWGTEDDSPDYKKEHIPGAIHVDIASIEGEPYWNLKSPKEVEQAILDLGITKDTTVILYGSDVSATARVAYAYLWAGVENVKILDGGLNAWKQAGYSLEKNSNKPSKAKDFGSKVPAHPEYQLSLEDTKKKLESDKNFKLLSIRSYNEFIGETSGYTYIPKAGEPKGAVWGKGGSDPYSMEDYTHPDGSYINMDEMRELWKDLDFDESNELSFYCGTGWRASIPFLIMYENGFTNISMYDGGWYQWQLDDTLPVQVGDPQKNQVTFTTVGELSNDKAAK